jgi:hypothetical protein
MRREAWLQRQHSSKPGPAAQTAAVASAVPVPEGEAAAATAVAVPAPEGEAAAAAAVLAPQEAAAAATSLQGVAQSWNSLCSSNTSSNNTTLYLDVGAKK